MAMTGAIVYGPRYLAMYLSRHEVTQLHVRNSGTAAPDLGETLQERDYS